MLTSLLLEELMLQRILGGGFFLNVGELNLLGFVPLIQGIKRFFINIMVALIALYFDVRRVVVILAVSPILLRGRTNKVLLELKGWFYFYLRDFTSI